VFDRRIGMVAVVGRNLCNQIQFATK
jgi:hypothetical protein